MESIEDHEDIKHDVHSSAVAVSAVTGDLLWAGKMETYGSESSE